MQKNAEQRTALSGNAFISWKDGQKNIAAPAVVLVQWPDRLRLDVTDPLGSVLASLVVNGDRFWFYNKEEKYAYQGKAEQLQKIFGFALKPQELVALFLARPALQGFRFLSEYEGEGALARMHSGAEEQLVWNARLLEPVEWRKSKSKEQIRVFFEDYATRLGIRAAEKISVLHQSGAGEHFFRLEWKDWQPHVPKNPTLFQIPPVNSFGRETKTF